MKELRNAFLDATDGLMRVVDGLMVSDQPLGGKGKGFEGLREWHEKLRRAKDELGSAEWGIEGLFHKLNFEEGELEEEEERFYSRDGAGVGSPVIDEVVLDRSISPVDEEDRSGRSSDDGKIDQDDELVVRFLERKGHAEQLKEQLDEMESRYYDLKEEQAFRTRHDLPFAEEKRTFIENFVQLHRAIIDQLEPVEEEVHNLRQQCISEGRFTALDHAYESHDALVEEIWGLIDDIRDRSPMRAAVDKHPGLLLRKADCKNKRDFINTWLWGWLQDNAVERWKFKEHIVEQCPASTAVDRDKERSLDDDEEEWSELALRLWYQDAAGDAMDEAQPLSTMDALLAESEGGRSASQCMSLLVDLGDRPDVGFGAWETSQPTIRTLSSVLS